MIGDKMRLLHIVVVSVVAHGLLLLKRVNGETSPRDVERALEEALKHIRGLTSSAEKPDISEATLNLTVAIQDLTSAVMNNTEMIATALGDREPFSGDQLPGRTKCEPPFFPLRSECFYVNRYKLVSWAEAREFCKGLGGDLAVPNDVNTLRATLLDKFPEDQYKSFWIGAKESGSEGSWVWVSTKPFQAKDWATGQPDGGNENCVILSRDDYPPLHDSPCYLNTLFICERVLRLQQ
ncbi:perlucin-like [Macrobrachium nipponense]|uniref:perlucin-like n=1 Tax=Macrobrachium nipponense TaxID=159736 RepID=UPI0030C8C688